jgi:hypothetical protein
MTPPQITEQANAIRWIVIGSLICEYGAMQLPFTKGELKQRANSVINFSRKLQQYFLHHPNASEESKEVFKKEFLKNEIVLMGQLLSLIWGISEKDLEEIIRVLSENIVEAEES